MDLSRYTIGHWIWRFNLEFVLIELSAASGYDYAQTDREAILFGLKGTDSEQEQYFEYSFIEESQIDFAIAEEPGTDLFMFLVNCQPETASSIEYILHLASTYDIRTRS